MISSSEDDSIKIFDVEGRKQLHHFKDAHKSDSSRQTLHLTTSSTGRICTIAVSQNGLFLASGSQDKSIKVFDLTTKKEIHHFVDAHDGNKKLFQATYFPPIGEIFSIAISPDNKFVVSGSGDKSIKIFDLETSKPIYHFTDAHDGKFLLKFIHISTSCR